MNSECGKGSSFPLPYVAATADSAPACVKVTVATLAVNAELLPSPTSTTLCQAIAIDVTVASGARRISAGSRALRLQLGSPPRSSPRLLSHLSEESVDITE